MAKRSAAILISTIAAAVAFSATAADRKMEIGKSNNVLVSASAQRTAANGIIGTGVHSNGIIGTGVHSNGIIGTGVHSNGIIGTGVHSNGIIGTGIVRALGIIGTG